MHLILNFNFYAGVSLLILVILNFLSSIFLEKSYGNNIAW